MRIPVANQTAAVDPNEKPVGFNKPTKVGNEKRGTTTGNCPLLEPNLANIYIYERFPLRSDFF